MNESENPAGDLADEGRPVKPHRSGGGKRIVISGGGSHSLMLASALAMALPSVQTGLRREVDWWGDRREPIDTGRRAEKDAIAEAKAEAKRTRRAAKRMKGAAK